MTDEELTLCLIFFAGVLFGWITKIPVFWHLYKEWQIERDHIHEITQNVLSRMDAEDSKKRTLKQINEDE